MLVLAFVLAAASSASTVEERPPQTMFEALAQEEQPAKPRKPVGQANKIVVAAASALGGVVGVGVAAGMSYVVVALAYAASSDDARVQIVAACALALPLGGGLGAGIAHHLVHGDGGFGAGLAGLVGTLAGAAIGAGVGYAFFPFAVLQGTPDPVLGAIMFGSAGALIGAAVGPVMHAAVE